VTGLVYDASQPGALGRAIEQLIADPGLVARMSLRCLRAAEQFRADVVVPQYERVYEEVLGVPL
jgi:glycosyltransferase involved in cell wall biosynthesis